MSKQRAEHLLILNEACKGLLVRVHWMKYTSSPPSLESKELASLLKHITRTFPKINSQEATQHKGYEFFESDKEKISSELEDWYFTIRDVTAFNEKAIAELASVSSEISTLDMNNFYLTATFFELLAGVVKLQIAMQMVENKARNIAAYIIAFELIQGKKDDHLQHVLQYMESVMGDQNKLEDRMWHTMLYLRERCLPLERIIRGASKGLLDPIQKWSSAASFEQKRMFSILYDATKIVQPSRTDRYLELEYLNNLREWMQYALLVCPAALQDDEARRCLNKIIYNYFVTPVVRDITFEFQKTWDKTFWEFKCGHISQGTKFYLKQYRDVIFKDSYVKANECALNHRALRRYLQKQLRQYVCLFTEVPGLAAPKFQLVLALIKLSSHEVHWYFQHVKASPIKAHKINWIKELNTDQNIIKLIEALCDLVQLVSKYAQLVKEYFTEYIREIDAPKCEAELKKFFQYTGEKIPKEHQDRMMKLLGDARNLKQDASFDALKLDFLRVTCFLSSSESGLAYAMAKPVLGVYGEMLTHFANVLHTEQQLVDNADIGSIIFYREQFRDVTNWTLGRPDLYSSSMSLIHILTYVKYTLNLKFCPDEQLWLIKYTSKYGEKILDEICKTVLVNFHKMRGYTKYLAEVGSLDVQVSKVLSLTSKKKNINPQQSIVPGQESKYGADGYFNFQKQSQALGLILGAIRTTRQIQVFTVVFNTYDWLYEALDNEVNGVMEKIFDEEDGSISRPSKALQRLHVLKRTLGFIEQHIPLNTSDIIRGNILKHFTKVSSGMIGEDIKIESKSNAVIQKIGKFYWDVITKQNIEFSPIHLKFSSRLVHGKRPKGEPMAEDYTAHSELKALCSIVGPFGVKALHSVFLSNLGNYISEMKSVVTRNNVYLGQLDFVDLASWWGNVVKIVGSNEFLQLGISVGRALQFLSMLKNAQRSVQDDGIPFVSKVVHLVMRRIESDGKIKAGKQLCNVLIDSGIEDPHYNLGIKNVFKKVFNTSMVLSHFPKMFACLFLSDVWKQTRFIPQTEGFNTGVESVITTIQTVIPALCETEQKSLELLKDFVVLSAHTLLHMNSKVEAKDRDMRDYHIPSMMVFMSKFMETCKGMSMHVLEECLPFTLMRTKIIEIYERVKDETVETKMG
ncbi:hypothetical protein AAMO2058_001053600 [Amorphochlora amoebiformis]